MAITFKVLTPPERIGQMVAEQVERLQQALVRNMCVIGEQVLNAARSTNSYKDQTGNLRSSLGYVVAVDGEIVTMSDFAVVQGPKGNSGEGAKTGKEYVLEVLRNFPQGIVLLVVAGMSYAACVSAKGYDVLDSAQLQADKLVPQMLLKLGFK